MELWLLCFVPRVNVSMNDERLVMSLFMYECDELCPGVIH